MQETIVRGLGSLVSWCLYGYGRLVRAWSDFWYPPHVPYIDAVLAISNENVESDTSSLDSDWSPSSTHENEVHDWMDLTKEYHATGTIDVDRIREKMDSFRIEYRYLYQRSKYRYAVDPDETDPSFPSNLDGDGSFTAKPLMARVCFPEGKNEIVLSRVLKYAGPRGDFYGGNRVRSQWLFPWWTTESFDGVTLHILDTYLRMHVFQLDVNSFLTLA